MHPVVAMRSVGSIHEEGVVGALSWHEEEMRKEGGVQGMFVGGWWHVVAIGERSISNLCKREELWHMQRSRWELRHAMKNFFRKGIRWSSWCAGDSSVPDSSRS